MIIPDLRCRPNPDRAIFIQEELNGDLFNRLVSQIIRLQHSSQEPITVYIDSPGGIVNYKNAILGLLKSSSQDFRSFHIITVGVRRIASAAADLLSMGDYALAYPDCEIIYHGTRVFGQEITAESGSIYAGALRAFNKSAALNLAHQIEYRFLFRFLTSKSKIDELRAASNAPGEYLNYFIELLQNNLSTSAVTVLQKALERLVKYYSLKSKINEKKPKNTQKRPQTKAMQEAAQIKCIVDFELKENRKNPNWSFLPDGLNDLTQDMFLLNEDLDFSMEERIRKLCELFGKFFIEDAELASIKNQPEEKHHTLILEKMYPIVMPARPLFIALCHALQQGENTLTAKDAYWLGLIDEVIGDPEMSTYRFFSEYRPEQDK